MKKPKKKNIMEYAPLDNFPTGFNLALSECEAYYEPKIRTLDENDAMIILQVEYNKMTGESLEQDVALEMVKALNRSNHE